MEVPVRSRIALASSTSNRSPMRASERAKSAFSFSPRAVAAALVLPQGSKVLRVIPYSAAAAAAKAMAKRLWAISCFDCAASPGEYSPAARLWGRSIMKPELRPAGPCATSLASTTTIDSPGRSWARRRAADRPAKPAPTISQSAVRSRSRDRTGVCRALRASQPDGPVSTGRRQITRSVTGSSRRPNGRTCRSRSSSARCTGRARRSTCRARRSRIP